MAKRKGQTTITIFTDWCKGCGLCEAFCPGTVFKLDKLGKAQVVREQECINCGFCERHCPDFAIRVRPKAKKAEATPQAEFTPRTESAPTPKAQPQTAAPKAPSAQANPQNETEAK